MLEEQNISNIVCKKLKLEVPPCDLTEWTDMLERIDSRNKSVTIALVGKYVKLRDAYLSVVEALYHGGYENSAKVDIRWIEAEEVNQGNVYEIFAGVDGILVPGGFGDRGVEGKIETAKYARENNIPFLGICLGMQIATIEFARNVLNYKSANSREFDEETKYRIIDFMENQNDDMNKGGTMRLGTYPCIIEKGTQLHEVYNELNISERHRHRYEFNNMYRNDFISNGMVFSGTSPDGLLVEAVEIPANDFYVAVQYHPEFKSRPNRAHPLFKKLIEKSLNKK